MFTLSYKPAGVDPTGKQRVFFACHPDDFERYFDEISNDILELQNCVIYYIDKEAEAEYDEELFLSYLAEMRLVVIPVTTNLLTRPSRALDVVYKFTQEGDRHIPVLTLMQEEQLDELYTRVFGDLQYLNKHERDHTAIPFKKKLAVYLMSVLVGDELAEKVRKSFDAYIFLSYRKKDRIYAQELMRLIHKNEFCRDIAIWYDEFLNPGEGFNNAIKAALNKSNLFALTVTPNLLEDHNYVMDEEYPLMKKAGKPILSAEMVDTDRKELEEKYIGIPACTDAHNAPKLSESLLQALEGIAKRENDSDQEHNFMIGLAYLNGIDVEVDVDRALHLITGAAEAGIPEAIEKLVDMYRNGDGVARDYLCAIEWQKKLVSWWGARYRESGEADDGTRYGGELQKLGDYWQESGRLSDAKSSYEEMLKITKRIAEETGEETGEEYKQHNLLMCYERLGNIAKEEDQLAEARDYYMRALEISLKFVKKMWTTEFCRDLMLIENHLGDIAEKEGQLAEAREYYEKALAACLILVEKTKTVESRRDLLASYGCLGDIARDERRLAEAREYYEKALEISLQLAEETGTVESRRDLSVSYDRLGDIAGKERRLAEAREYYEKAFEISLKLAEEIGTVKDRHLLMINYGLLGNIAGDERRLAEAREYYNKALEINLELVEETGTVEFRRGLSVSYDHLGDIAGEERRLAEAREYFEKSFEISLKLVEETGTVESRRGLLASYDRLGHIAKEEGKLAEARKYYEKAFEISLKLVEETGEVGNRRWLVECYDHLGDIAKEEDQLVEARGCYERAFEISLKLAEEIGTVGSRRDLSVSYNKLGDIAKEEGHLAEARGYYEKAFAINLQLAEGTGTVESRRGLSISYERLGDIARDERRLSEAREYYEKSLEIRLKLAEGTGTVESHRDLSVSYDRLGDIAYEEGQLAEAREYYAKLLEIRLKLVEETGTAESYDNLAASCCRLGIVEYLQKSSNGKAYLLKALEIWEALVKTHPNVSRYKKWRDNVKAVLNKLF